jgi:hypothetical protein
MSVESNWKNESGNPDNELKNQINEELYTERSAEEIRQSTILGANYDSVRQAWIVEEPVEVKTFFKVANMKDGGLEGVSSGVIPTDIDGNEVCLVYSGDASPEENNVLIADYWSWDKINFLEYHKDDLIKCLGGESDYNRHIQAVKKAMNDQGSYSPRVTSGYDIK